jgi:adenosylhomocysteinase
MPIEDAAQWGDLFVTATGNLNVIRAEHFCRMKDGAILANSGHFDAEIELPALQDLAKGGVREVRTDVEEYDFGDKKLYLVAQGRLVNLSAAEGHPASVMDMSFANQALGAEWVAQHHGELERRVYTVPDEIDREVARLKLEALGTRIDEMTEEQQRYVSSWEHGT